MTWLLYNRFYIISGSFISCFYYTYNASLPIWKLWYLSQRRRRLQQVLCRRPVVVAKVEQRPEHRLVGRVDPGEDRVPGDLGVARVRLDDRGDSLEQVKVLQSRCWCTLGSGIYIWSRS